MIETPAPGTARPDGQVTYRDSEGGVWEVHEVVVSPASPWARGARCLLFRSPGSIRRVWTYPPEWRTLGPAELEQLSWRT